MIGSARKGIAILIAMTLIFVPLLGIAVWSEVNGNPAFTPLGIDQIPSALQPGGNMEGKEVRFGPVQSAFFSVVTTVTSCGAVNSMHDSFMPLGGFVQMFDMQLGEIVFGGVGSGLYYHAHFRNPCDVHRRADGRADPGALWQEDRAVAR